MKAVRDFLQTVLWAVFIVVGVVMAMNQIDDLRKRGAVLEALAKSSASRDRQTEAIKQLNLCTQGKRP